jgi:hypothetical protein
LRLRIGGCKWQELRVGVLDEPQQAVAADTRRAG